MVANPNLGFEYLSQFQVFFVAILIFALIYGLLKMLTPFGNESNNLNLVIAFLSALIVSFTGVVTYLVTYAINWFVILFFIFFVIFLLLAFLGVKLGDIHGIFAGKKVLFLAIFFILFLAILLKAFFALNNVFDTENPQDDVYDVNVNSNFGVEEMGFDGPNTSWWDKFWNSFNIDDGLIAAVLFLIGLGIFAIILNRS